MTDLEEKTFETAVEALYSPLHQSATKEAIEAAAARRTHTVADLRTYLQRIGLLMPQTTGVFASKRLVHIAGTKGKGSTACLCESILRNAYGFKTGLFTSPHLVDIRERIRINGQPVSKSVFGQVYWELRERLEANCDDNEGDNSNNNDDDDDEEEKLNQREQLPKLPGYFRMLTLMALYIFANYDPSIDVIILEVGMGGRYDATNILDLTNTNWRSFACGVTLLDYDHVRVLGHRIEQIAWEKGGIFQIHKGITDTMSPRPPDDEKGDNSSPPDPPTDPVPPAVVEPKDRHCFFALDTNPKSALVVLRECALIEGEGSELHLVGGYSTKAKLPAECPIGLPGKHQRTNAELAVALCEAVTEEAPVDEELVYQALGTASWPGRCQTVKVPESSNITLRLDGAHTVESLTAGLEWYQMVTNEDNRILFFNCSHERNPVELLELLVPIGFQTVFFCRADSERPSSIRKKTAAELLGLSSSGAEDEDESWQDTLAKIWIHLQKGPKFTVVSNVTVGKALEMMGTQSCPEGSSYEILVTGSLYLVGSALSSVDWKETEAAGSLNEQGQAEPNNG